MVTGLDERGWWPSGAMGNARSLACHGFIVDGNLGLESPQSVCEGERSGRGPNYEPLLGHRGLTQGFRPERRLKATAIPLDPGLTI